MIHIHQKLKEYKTNMILQVHDELVFDVHKSELDNVKQMVKEEMENAYPIAVPLTVDMGVGENWLEAH
jgi:DNA polymerase-1